MGDVRLIGSFASIFSTRIEWALKLKGVEYEYLEEDLWNKSPMLLNCNPVHKKVPVLVYDGKPIPESRVILDYIDEIWKDTPLLPEDPYERAVARFWAQYGDEKCVHGAFAACWSQGKEKEKNIESAAQSFAHFEKQIKGKKFFGGEKIGYLDIVMGWIPHWLTVMEEVGDMKLVDPEQFPSLYQWTQNIIHIPPIRNTYPPREKLVQHFKLLVSSMRSGKR